MDVKNSRKNFAILFFLFTFLSLTSAQERTILKGGSELEFLNSKQKKKIDLGLLYLSKESEKESWNNNELTYIESFLNDSTDYKISKILGIQLHSSFFNYASWVKQSRKRGLTNQNTVSSENAEYDLLQIISDAIVLLGNKEYVKSQEKIRTGLNSFLLKRYQINSDSTTDWRESLVKKDILNKTFLSLYISEAQQSLGKFFSNPKPKEKDLVALYQFGMAALLARCNVILYYSNEYQFSLDQSSIEILRNYIQNGGLIYIVNSSTSTECMANRGLINQLIDEKLFSSQDRKNFNRIAANDRRVTGYTFERPVPQIFHPRTIFSFSLPQKEDIEIAILDSVGNKVFGRVLQKRKDGYHPGLNDQAQHWAAIDSNGTEVPSGFYIYQAEAGLFKESFPLRVSMLRRCNSNHQLFRSLFTLWDLPSASGVIEDNLPYKEKGVYTVAFNKRTALIYTEGYKEIALLSPIYEPSDRIPALRWIANVISYSLNR